MPPPLENVREKLLRAGIAPRHVRRYVAELRDHLVDLTGRERSGGLDPQAAEARARALLGTDEHLARALIESTPRSVAGRAPWAICFLLPVTLLFCVHWATGNALMHILSRPVHGMAPFSIPDNYRGPIEIVSFVSTYLLGPLLLLGCTAIALRQRLESRWIVVGLASIALVSAVLGFHMRTVPSPDGHADATVFSMVRIVYLQGRFSVLATLGLAVLRACLLFVITVAAYRTLNRRLFRAQP